METTPIVRCLLAALVAAGLVFGPSVPGPLGPVPVALADDDDDDDDGPSGGGSSGGGSTGGGSTGGGSTGGGSTGGGSKGGGGTPDDGDDDGEDGDEDRGGRGEDRDEDRSERSGRSGREEDGHSGLARLRDLLFGRTDPSADREDRFRPGEILAVDLSAEGRRRLVRQGFEVLDQRRLATLGITVTRLAPPSDRPLLEALALARASDPATVFDLNHLYRGLLCEGCWATAGAALRFEAPRCGTRQRIGLLDGAVDTGHPALARKRIRSRSFVAPGIAASAPEHGTAVASLLVGSPMGLVPEAELLVAEVLGRGSAGAEADSLALASGLDWLSQSGARIVNASLAGPANRSVELAVYFVQRRGAVLVAAAGNGGPAAPPAYPAAFEGVVAVTADDQRLEPWRKANRGAYIAFAAPGVDVPVAVPGGGLRPASGTYFAAPFVTATLAAAAGGRDPRAALVLLVGKARDLGSPGRDPVFGYGLVQAVGCRS
ncbi:MAG: S8 family serine peptidase [Geminicoccaceae bacterium]|nr:S8 family serine peptidase [Geminicoccaceae bacterium]